MSIKVTEINEKKVKIKCTCDRCGKSKTKKLAKAEAFAGWLEVVIRCLDGEEHELTLCPECVEVYVNLREAMDQQTRAFMNNEYCEYCKEGKHFAPGMRVNYCPMCGSRFEGSDNWTSLNA